MRDVRETDRSERIAVVATAIANARGARFGAPPLADPVGILAPNLRAELMEEAEAAYDAAWPQVAPGAVATATLAAKILGEVLDHVLFQARSEGGSLVDVRVEDTIPAELSDKAAELLLDVGR